MSDHNVKIYEKDWNQLAAILGVDPEDRGRTVGNHVRNLVHDDIRDIMNGKPKIAIEPKVEPKIEPSKKPISATMDFFGASDIPRYTDTSGKHDPWPLTPEVAAFAHFLGLTPAMLKPIHTRDQDEEYKINEEKKFWIRCGYRMEGMGDPQTSAEHVAGDIMDDRPASDLPERALSAHNAMRGKFRAWWRQRSGK
jgi:hypothetical protein